MVRMQARLQERGVMTELSDKSDACSIEWLNTSGFF